MAVNLFDVNFYRAANSDLAGLNESQLQSHFQSFGLNEGRRFSAFADLNFYRASNSDLSNFTNRQAYDHLSNFGVKEGRKFTPFADLNFYRSNNSDLAGLNNEQLLQHLQSSGVAEGRKFSPFVDIGFYKNANGDLASFSNNQALQHLVINGITEGRNFSPVIDLDFYLAANRDLTQAFGGTNRQQGFFHLATNGVDEGRRFSVAYDTNFYRTSNADLAAARLSNRQLLEHFQLSGLNEGRASSDRFNVSFYLANNADLRALRFTNQQALQHFDLYGFQEGRRASSNITAESKPLLTQIRQFGTSGDDTGGATVDSAGNIYVAGQTSGSLAGTNAGNYDAFVIKLDGRGNQLWAQQTGTSGYDAVFGGGVDAAGNGYISGAIDGSFVTPRTTSGATVATVVSGTDTFLAKYDRNGNRLFSNTVINSFSTSSSSSLALDSAGNVYISGFIDGNAFVGKYNSSGNQLWQQRLGSFSTNSFGITVDRNNNVYITGYTDETVGTSSAGGRDAFIAKYDTNGVRQWVQQLGTSADDLFYRTTTDATGNVYVTGNTTGSLGVTNAGGSDAFVVKYNTNGTRLWAKQLGTSSDDYSNGIALDAAGNVYIAGSTKGNLGGTNAGGLDAWFAKYDTNGNQIWTQQLGTSGDDAAGTIAINSAGNIILSGETGGSLGGSNAGSYDVWLARYI